MKTSISGIKAGNIILHNSKYLTVLKAIHTQPGKGVAYIQLEMKDIQDGTKVNCRFRSTEGVEKIRLDEEHYQFLYKEEEFLVVMHQQNFEQKRIHQSLVGKSILFLKEGMQITLDMHNDYTLRVHLPKSVEMTIQKCESVVSGQTAHSSYKPAILQNDVRVMVPSFIIEGDKIIIDINELRYIERSK